MTSPHLDDERLSDLIDGVATPTDVDHVAGCADCRARLAAWEAGLRLVADKPVAPDAVRDAAVAAALAAADEPEAEPDVAPIVPLTARRRVRWARAVAGVAAAVLVVGVAYAAVHGNHSQQHGTVSGAAASELPASASTTAPGHGTFSGSTTEPNSSSAGGASGAQVSLGAFTTVTALGGALRPLIGSAGVSAVPSGFSANRSHCPVPTADSGLPGAPLVLTRSLEYQSTPANVYVFASSGSYAAVVISTASCAILTRFTFK